MLTTEQIVKAGESFDVFTPVDRVYSDRYSWGFTQKGEQTLCYKGLDCIFFEEHQFLVLRGMSGHIEYSGYCCDLYFFLMLCKHLSPGGIFNDFPLSDDDL